MRRWAPIERRTVMKARNWSIIALLAIVAILLSACNIVRGSGDLVTESRDVSGFDSIDLSGTGEVIITQGEGESLTIETDDNIMEHITSEVRGGTLYLGTEDLTNILPTRLVFTLGVDELSAADVSGSGSIEAGSIETDSLELDVSGSGSVNVDSLTAGDLSVRISGSGDIKLAGEVPEQDIDISGSGNYGAGDLLSETAIISVSGSGAATLWATGSLDADVSGSGSIDYYGNPTVTSSTSGSSDINGLGEK
jgi:predicted small secreted protein